MDRQDNLDNFIVGNITISPQHNTMTVGEKSCRLQPKVMAVLRYLFLNKDRVINNDELLEHVWQGRVVTHSSIQKCINALRTAFNKCDDNHEYVVYFSKQGYQLVAPVFVENFIDNETDNSNVNKAADVNTEGNLKKILLLIISVLVLILVYITYSVNVKVKEPSKHLNSEIFSQVKPYVSNTGRETFIEPHINSNRVAFIREERPNQTNQSLSQLFIQGTNGQQWRVSSARGNFIALAWSPSGRNLVAIDKHTENTTSATTERTLANYYTFHIYTLDFKAEKVIEKNLLSHWKGRVSSVSWWDESALIYTAAHGEGHEYSGFRYDIAEQKLTRLMLSSDYEKLSKLRLLSSYVLNKKTALLYTGEQEQLLLNPYKEILFLDENQRIVNSWPIAIPVLSMYWLADGQGVLMLSDKNRLFTLTTTGLLTPIHYSPNLDNEISLVRSIDKGQSIVLTVKPKHVGNQGSIQLGYSENSSPDENYFTDISQTRFMQHGGGFIYSQLDEH